MYIYMGVWIGGSPAGAEDTPGAVRRSLGHTRQGCVVSLGSIGETLGYDASIVWESWHKLGTTRDNMLAPKGPQRGLREAEGYGSMYFARVNFRRDQITCSFKGWVGLRMHFYR